MTFLDWLIPKQRSKESDMEIQQKIVEETDKLHGAVSELTNVVVDIKKTRTDMRLMLDQVLETVGARRK